MEWCLRCHWLTKGTDPWQLRPHRHHPTGRGHIRASPTDLGLWWDSSNIRCCGIAHPRASRRRCAGLRRSSSSIARRALWLASKYIIPHTVLHLLLPEVVSEWIYILWAGSWQRWRKALFIGTPSTPSSYIRLIIGREWIRPRLRHVAEELIAIRRATSWPRLRRAWSAISGRFASPTRF